jgi:hypothetical protein
MIDRTGSYPGTLNMVIMHGETALITRALFRVITRKTCKCTTSNNDNRKGLLQMWCAGKSAIMAEARVNQILKPLDCTTYSIHNSKFLFRQGNNS